MVYKSHLFPNIVATTELWREEIIKHGFPGIYLITVDDWNRDNCSHPRDIGFDASYEIPSNLIHENMIVDTKDKLDLDQDFVGRIVDYRKFAQFHMGRPFPKHKRFRTVMLPWDNTPRYASKAMVHINTDGEEYRTWLTNALLDTRARYAPQERIVFIHSWNEWCEGTYLEPDGNYGRRYLEETRGAFADARTALGAIESGDQKAVVLARRLAREKDRAVFLNIEAMRSQMLQCNEIAFREALQAVYQSTSWRLTAPMRWLALRLRGSKA